MDKKTLLIDLAYFGGGLVVGAGLGYLISKKKHRAQAEAEIADVKSAYEVRVAQQPYSSPEEAVAALLPDEAVFTAPTIDEELAEFSEAEQDDSLSEHPLRDLVEGYQKTLDEAKYGGVSLPESITTEQNIFDAPFVTVVDPDNPYIISTDEFYDDSNGYSKQTIIYYEADVTLATEDNAIVTDVDGTIGAQALKSFGVGSGDENMVFIRNERLQSDIEVIKEDRGYSDLILKVAPEKKRPTPRKMREGDDQ